MVPRFQILPTETRFFDLFDQHAQTLHRAATQLRELVEDFTDVDGKFDQLTETEHRGDFITHEVIDLARRSFTMPFDTEDITAIAGRLDDGIDGIQAAADALILWKIEQPTPEAKQLCAIIERATAELAAAVPHLRDKRRFDQIRKHNVEVNRLENEADRLLRDELAALFEGGTDAIEVIKWKELYETMESVTDRCEDVVNVIEGIVLKIA